MEMVKKPSEEFTCVICGDKLSFYSIGKCNHKEICYYCAIKNRLFYDDFKCPLCNTNLSIVFICPISVNKTFEELSQKNLSSYYKIEEDSKDLGIYYMDFSAYEAAIQLNIYKCPIEYCTRTDPFETYEELSKHLFMNHQKFYCKVCIKDGKKFISEQKIYDKNEIKEHNLYGDIEEEIPPHHFCPFCKELFYNDEILYKHMSSSHFLCEICKTNKKILFYSALPNLIQHNNLYHYCCPFKDCKEVLYIAFGSKKKLIEHFETKHNQKDSNINEKMAEENMPKIIEDPTFYDVSLEKDEFDFNEYMQKVNKRCIQHRENKLKENNNQENFNKDGIEIIYTNAPQNNYSNHDNYYSDKYYEKNRNSNNNFTRGRGRGRGRGRKINTFDLQSLKQDLNRYEEPKNSEEEEEEEYMKQNCLISINNFIELIKKYVVERLKEKKISPKELYLPKETQYQIIMVINKMEDFEKILELFNIQIFGLDWDKINILKEYLKKTETLKEKELFSEFDSLTIKNVLVLYNYLIIAYKKLSKKFYKLDMEQIDEDLYHYFIPDSNKEKSNSSFGLNHHLNEGSNKKNKNKKHNKNKFKWNQKIIPGLNDFEQKKPKTKKNKEEEMKKNFDKFVKECKIEDEKLEKEKEKENKNTISKKNDSKSNLAKLINSGSYNTKNNSNNKKKAQINGEFKLSDFNLDKDFPSLKKKNK
jgi:hypothetical protein